VMLNMINMWILNHHNNPIIWIMNSIGKKGSLNNKKNNYIKQYLSYGL
jgi:hypothetical protein